MARPEFDAASGFYRIYFRFGGRQFRRSAKVKDQRRAEAICGVVEETIRDIQRGMLTIPEGVDPGNFILSGGKLTAKVVVSSPPKALTLKAMLDRYAASVQPKEPGTRRTEATHAKHLIRLLGRDAVVDRIEKKDIQGYVDRRSGETYTRTGQRTKQQTIKKELGTLSVIWNWARDAGEVCTGPPTQKLRFPKGGEKHPFRTWDECQRAAARAGLSGRDRLSKFERAHADSIWESLFLTEDEILLVLDHVRKRQIFPMLAFAAYTGARRSEMCRAEIDDIDFANGMIKVREKKRDSSKSMTFRHVPLHDDLREILTIYLASHPGGARLFCGQGSGPLTGVMATKRLRAAFKGSRWDVLHGWHTFRHSFASNLARRNVAQSHIDGLMGHETEAMRRRYRHLFPQDLAHSVGRLFSKGEQALPLVS